METEKTDETLNIYNLKLTSQPMILQVLLLLTFNIMHGPFLIKKTHTAAYHRKCFIKIPSISSYHTASWSYMITALIKVINI